MAALQGAPVDRVPVSLWLHNFATENSAETLAAETARLARRFEWDFLKPQSRRSASPRCGDFATLPRTRRPRPTR
jgi:uroporphyrinogen decarboxylase